MKHRIAILLLCLVPLASPAAGERGLDGRFSPYPVGETLDRLETLLRAKGITVFARIDHSAAARGAGLTLRPTQLPVFGNPKAGTPMLQAVPGMAPDLPMKVLARQDDRGQVRVAWNSPDFLVQRHGLDPTFTRNLAAIEGLVDAALK